MVRFWGTFVSLPFFKFSSHEKDDDRYNNSFLFSIETSMNLYVHTRTMKIVLSTKDPRLRASPRRCGGAPSGVAAFIVADG